MRPALRPFRPEDFETLYEIDQACYPRGIAYSRRTLRAILAMPRADCIVAEAGAEIVGFLVSEFEGSYGHIITIDVLEAHRRTKIGTRLLLAAEERLAARGVRLVGLETATDNHAAIAFWEKHGYRTRGVLKNYYPGPLDAFSMTKSLVRPAQAHSKEKR